MEQNNIPEDLEAQKLAETLSYIVGKTFTFKRSKWEDSSNTIRNYYVSRMVQSTELHYSPSREVKITFNDGDFILLSDMCDFNDFIGKVGDYGSAYDYLMSESNLDAFLKKNCK